MIANVIIRTKKINFPEQQVFCVFPDAPANLADAISKLELTANQPVIVLIGGDIQEQQAAVTRAAIETLAKVAEDLNALLICGGTEMGVMAEIGQIRKRNSYKFPLVGITPEALVTWPDGPLSTKFLWWGTQRWNLAPHYTHFILVPGNEFGDESPWIVRTATLLSKNKRSVTVLINGGEISKKDIELSIENNRPVIVLGGTGRLANEIAGKPKQDLITVIAASAESRIVDALRAALL